MDIVFKINHAKPFDRAVKVKPLTAAGREVLAGLGATQKRYCYISDLSKLLAAATTSLLAFSVEHRKQA